MGFLQFLEGLRNPFCDAVLGALTYLGDETAFLVIGLIIFWCVCKQEGYFLLSGGLSGTVVSQWLKIACRVPRPWVQQEGFTIVESARAGATGYSFPSGHSQIAVSAYGGMALWSKRKAVRVVGAVLAVLVCFSRMYLGVHTPLDVCVGAGCALVISLVLLPLMKKDDPRVNRAVFLALLALSIAYLAYMSITSFPADTDPDNLAEAVKNAYTLLGCSAGMLLIHELDVRRTHFDTRAVWWAQIIKVVLGLGLTLALRIGLKPVLAALLGEGSGWANAGRYFLLVLFAGGVWPLTFRFFSRLGKAE